jgi:PAS domain-containing protein
LGAGDGTAIVFMQRGALPSSFKLLLGIAAGLIGLGVFATGLTIVALRGDTVRNTEQNTGNIATILAQQTAHAVKLLDDKLSQLRQQVADTGAENVDDLRVFLHNRGTFVDLNRQLLTIPHADVILLISDDGRLVNSTRRWPIVDLDFNDRDYFRHFRSHDDSELFLGLPVEARLVGTPTLYMAKRLNTRSGAFLGVVVIGVPLSYFQHIYDSITDFKGQSFLFLRRDGTVLVRYPDVADRAGMKMPPDSPWYDLVRKGGGSYRSPGYFDGGARLAAVRPLSGFPLVVNVGANEDAALATWRRRATLIALGTLLAVCCTVLLLWALAGQVRRLALSQATLAQREAGLAEKSGELQQVNARLDAAVNNMSQGLCMFDNDGRLALRNDRYLSMYRLSPDAVRPGCRPFEMLEQRIANGTFLGDPGRIHGRRHGPHRRRPAVLSFLRTRRRPRHRGVVPADRRRRLGRHPRGHHRTAENRSAHRPHGAP